ncbi:MAG: YqaJ viral recombinase family protein [Dysgonomonas sp.]
MKVYKEVLQQSPEWYELKYGKIGGSSLAKVMANRTKPIRDNAIYTNLLAARFEPFEYEETFTSSDMDRGNMYEPLACDEFARVYNVELEQYGWIEDDGCLYGLSPDRLFDSMKQAVECKCPSRDKHMSYILNPISMVEEYVWQVVDYFLNLPKLKKLYFISYRPENTIKPLLVHVVTNRTVLSISAKERLPVSDLVVLAKSRLIELNMALSEDVAKYKQQIEF